MSEINLILADSVETDKLLFITYDATTMLFITYNTTTKEKQWTAINRERVVKIHKLLTYWLSTGKILEIEDEYE